MAHQFSIRSIANFSFYSFYCFIRHKPTIYSYIVSVDGQFVDGNQRNGISFRFSFLPKSPVFHLLYHIHTKTVSLESRDTHSYFVFVCVVFSSWFRIRCFFPSHKQKRVYRRRSRRPPSLVIVGHISRTEVILEAGHCAIIIRIYVYTIYFFFFSVDRLPRPREIATNILPPSFNRSTIHIYTYEHGVIVAVRILRL